MLNDVGKMGGDLCSVIVFDILYAHLNWISLIDLQNTYELDLYELAMFSVYVGL